MQTANSESLDRWLSTDCHEEGAAECAVCQNPLGKRYLRPRHTCAMCQRLVCAACSPGQYPTAKQAYQDQASQRTCCQCMKSAMNAPQRLCEMAKRLKELLITAEGGSKEVNRTYVTNVEMPSPFGGNDVVLERCFELCESALFEVEDAGAALRRRADRAEAVGLVERQMREELEKKLAATKDSAEQLGHHLVNAKASVDSIVAPLLDVGKVSPDVEEWGRVRPLTEDWVRDIQNTAREAKEQLLDIGDRLIDVPGAKRRPFVRPCATDSVNDLVQYCSVAITSLKESAEEQRLLAMEDHISTTSSHATSGSPTKPSRTASSGLFSRNSISMSSTNIGGFDGVCTGCGTLLGKRHLTRRHHCDYCQHAFCGHCTRALRSCEACLEEARVAPTIVKRIDALADHLREACGKKPLGSESGSLDQAMSACETSFTPLKDVKAGTDVSMSLLMEIRTLLDDNAKAAAAANVDLGARLAVLCERNNSKVAVAKAKQAAVAVNPNAGQPKAVMANPASPSFWETSEKRVTASGV